MNINFNKKNVAQFGQHVANWIAEGMIIKDGLGRYPVTEADVDNWLVACDKSIYRHQISFIQGLHVAKVESLNKPISLNYNSEIIWFECMGKQSRVISFTELRELSDHGIIQQVFQAIDEIV
jgi:hypothetical protein